MNTLFVYIAWLAWILLCIVMLAKPFTLLFKGIFSKLLPLRHWLGVILSLSVFVHVLIFSSNLNFDFSFFIKPSFWNFKGLISWGMLAFLILLPVFITSNKFSIKLLKKNWKRIQRLSYFLFVFAGIHIYLATGYWYYTILPITVWIITYMIALIKRKKQK